MMNKEIGKIIKGKRKELKISQKDFADKLGKSVRTVQKYEKGEIEAPLQVLTQIAEILDCPIEELVNSNSVSPNASALENLCSALMDFEAKTGISIKVNDLPSEGNGTKKLSITLETTDNDEASKQINFIKRMYFYREALGFGDMPQEFQNEWKNKVMKEAKNITDTTAPVTPTEDK